MVVANRRRDEETVNGKYSCKGKENERERYAT